MKESWQNLIDLVGNPSATFERLKSNPKWILAFVVFCLFSVVLGWANAPYTQKLLYQQNATQEEFNTTTSLISVIASALVIALLWDIMLSPILTIVARVSKTSKKLTIKHIYAGVVHTSLVRLLIFLVNIGVVPIFRSVESVNKVIDVRILPGLHHLAGSSENASLLIFLSYVNVLSIWYLIVLALAITTFVEVKKTTAYFVSIVIWFIRIVAETLFVVNYFPS